MSCRKIFFDDFGANTVPGTTDMTKVFQAAAEAVSDGDILKCIPGTTYIVTETTTILNNVTIDATGATIMAAEPWVLKLATDQTACSISSALNPR